MGLLALWCLLTYTGAVAPLFLPSPTAVIRAGWLMFVHERFSDDVLLSLARVFGGFLASVLLAVPFGLVIGSSARMDVVFAPLFGFIRYIPATAFIPLVILWFGIGFLQNVVLVFISIFFYLALLVGDSARAVKQDLVDTALTLGAERRQVLVRVVLPRAMPDIWNSMRTMFGVGWTMIVVAELVGAETGVGAKIIHAQRFLQTPKVLAGIFVIGMLGAACDLTFRALHRAFFPWAHL